MYFITYEMMSNYYKVKDLLVKDIFENCYIFEYIEQYNTVDYYNIDDRFADNDEDKVFVNDLKYRKCKDIIKIEDKCLNEYDINSVLKWANEGHDDIHFYFNRHNNIENPNKHLYKILSVSRDDDYECSYVYQPDGEQNTLIKIRNIIPISLIPFEM
tara:strand:+ start:105 stop:575 length:471 start_codon:yes stop_codon:yes gene_type:complete